MGVLSCSKRREGWGSWRGWRVGARPDRGKRGMWALWETGDGDLQVLDLFHFLVDEGLWVGLFPPGWIGCEVSFWGGLKVWCCWYCWCC